METLNTLNNVTYIKIIIAIAVFVWLVNLIKRLIKRFISTWKMIDDAQ